MITSKQRRWAILAAVAAAILLTIRVLGLPHFDWATFRSTLLELDRQWLALSIALAYATYYGRALRWAVFLRPVRPRPRIWDLVKATVIGFAAVTLFGRPGEIVRPYLIARSEEVPLTSQLAAWLIERLFDLLAALAIFGYGLSRLSASRARVGGAMAWAFHTGGLVAAVLSAICLILLILLRHSPETFQARLLDALGFLHPDHVTRAKKWISSFLQGIQSLRSTRSMLELVGYTVLEWILIGGCYFSVIRSFGAALQFGFVDVFIYMGFVAFGTVIQLPGIGGGMQVVSVLVLREIFGLSLELATGVTVILWIITFVITVPVGIGFALQNGLSFRELKELREESSL